jgi:hypothetical protein
MAAPAWRVNARRGYGQRVNARREACGHEGRLRGLEMGAVPPA